MTDAPARRPAYSQEAEMAVLGGMMIDADAPAKAVAILPDPAAFHRDQHRKLFVVLVRLWERGSALDEITVSAELQQCGDYDSVGGMVFLASLLDASPTAANIEYHAAIVRDHYQVRRLAATANKIAQATQLPVEDVPALLDWAETEVMQVAERRHDRRHDLAPIKEGLWDTFERLEKLERGGAEETGIGSPFERLDELTGRFQEEDLAILAARPSMGKTALLNCLLLHAGIKEQKPGALFSLEVSKPRINENLLCIEGHVDRMRMRRGRLQDDDYARLATAAGFLNAAPIYVDDTPGITVAALRAKARRLKADRPDLAWIAVDYLQLMTGGGTGRRAAENRQLEVAEISRGLKNLARELGVVMFALSQLSRAVEARKDKRPMMSDLRESGTLEQDADLIMFLYRPEYYFGPVDSEGNNLVGVAELIVGKQRGGATGMVPLHFHKEYTRFEPA